MTESRNPAPPDVDPADLVALEPVMHAAARAARQGGRSYGWTVASVAVRFERPGGRFLGIVGHYTPEGRFEVTIAASTPLVVTHAERRADA